MCVCVCVCVWCVLDMRSPCSVVFASDCSSPCCRARTASISSCSRAISTRASCLQAASCRVSAEPGRRALACGKCGAQDLCAPAVLGCLQREGLRGRGASVRDRRRAPHLAADLAVQGREGRRGPGGVGAGALALVAYGRLVPHVAPCTPHVRRRLGACGRERQRAELVAGRLQPVQQRVRLHATRRAHVVAPWDHQPQALLLLQIV